MKGTSAGLWLALTVGPMVGGIFLLLLVIAFLSGWFSRTIPPGRAEVTRPAFDPRQEAQEPVQAIRKQYVEEAVGTVRAANRTEISARVMAAITRITVHAGDLVKEGDVLVELDRQAILTQVSQAKAALASADAALSEANDAYDRAMRLRNQNVGAITDQDFKQAASRVDVATAEQSRAKEALAEAEVNLSYATIKASRSGKIVDRLAEPGDMTRPGQPLLTLYDPQTLRLEVSVMENLEGKLEIGQKVPVYIDALSRKVEGVVDEKVPQADAASRSFLVKIKLPPIEGLYEGMFGRVQIAVGERLHLCLNTAAIQRIGQLEFVDVVRPDDSPQRNLVKERRMITTGRLGRPGHVEVLSGLEAGEEVAIPRSAAAAPSAPQAKQPGGRP